MSLNTGWTEMQSALKTLRLRWEAIQDVWQDSTRADFEEHTWKPLDDQVRATLQGMDRLSQMLSQLKHDCS